MTQGEDPFNVFPVPEDLRFSQLGYNVRYANSKDIPNLAVLVNTSFTVENFFKNRLRTSEKELEVYFESNEGKSLDEILDKGFFLVFEEGEVLVATIFIRVFIEKRKDKEGNEKDERVIYFGYLSVRQDIQGKGIGTEIIKLVEVIGRRLNCIVIQIQTVDVRPELDAYYGKKGFIFVKQEPFYNDLVWPQYVDKVLFNVSEKPLN